MRLVARQRQVRGGAPDRDARRGVRRLPPEFEGLAGERLVAVRLVLWSARSSCGCGRTGTELGWQDGDRSSDREQLRSRDAARCHPSCEHPSFVQPVVIAATAIGEFFERINGRRRRKRRGLSVVFTRLRLRVDG